MVSAVEAPAFLRRDDLDRLIALLHDDGRTVIAPTVADGAIVYDEIRSAADLPAGWRDEQEPGRYRLVETDNQRTFDFSVGPTSWKRYTFPSRVPIGRADCGTDGLSFEPVQPDPPALAFLGVRGCELAALRIQDRVLAEGSVADPDYVARRNAALVIAVECSVASATCFCTSMGTGPEVRRDDADLVLTELDDGFVVRAGSEVGRSLAERLPLEAAGVERTERGRASVARMRRAIGDPVAVDGLRDRLLAQLESPRWAEVADRCLACANCTLVCPTCFCTSVSQLSDLDADTSVAVRGWDSCFSGDFAKVAGGNFRSRREDRYRQWLTHKFATWIDQFGTSGCVGCGRCITWCPVGIDVREELAAIASPPLARILPPAAAGAPGAFVTGSIERIDAETADTTTLVVAVDPLIAEGGPGQFLMVTRPGLPAVPISISRYRPADGRIELSIRAAGPATATLGRLAIGDEIGLRGPLGQGWPVEAAEGRDVVVVAGGIGLSPLRPLVDELLAGRDRFGTVRLYHGARTPDDRPHVPDLEAWARRRDIDLAVTVDRAGEGWTGPVGVVTHLFDSARWDGREAVAFVCGPERMMQATAATLLDRGLRPERIHVSLERHMECGIGLCGHCQMGRFFVCRDGPVFTLADLGPTFSLEGILMGAVAARPRVGVVKLTSCDGCQLAILDLEDELLAISERFAFVDFPEATSNRWSGPFDVLFVEGSVSAPDQVERLHELRARTAQLVVIGACATAGGIQAMRNWGDVADWSASVYPDPGLVAVLDRVTPVSDHVKVDAELRGCPISTEQLREFLAALLTGRRPFLPDEAVCLECKRRGYTCVLVSGDATCLGPVTRAGCGAICPAFGRGCYGCFGPREQPNVMALTSRFERGGLSPDEAGRRFAGFTGWAEPFRAAIPTGGAARPTGEPPREEPDARN